MTWESFNMSIIDENVDNQTWAKSWNYPCCRFSLLVAYIWKLSVWEWVAFTLAAILLMQTKIIIIKFKLPDLNVSLYVCVCVCGWVKRHISMRAERWLGRFFHALRVLTYMAVRDKINELKYVWLNFSTYFLINKLFNLMRMCASLLNY